MADYSQLAYTPLFDPFSYEEIAAPGLQLEERHRELEDAYANMTDQEVLDMMLGSEGVYYDAQGNKHSRSEATQELVNNYRKELQRLVGLLSTYGVQGTSRQAMLNLKRLYEGKIKPIKELFDKREEEIKKQRDFKMQHPDAVFDNDISSWSIDDMMGNPTGWYNYNTVQLNDVVKLATDLTSAITDSQMRAWVESTGNKDLITQYQRTGVLSQQQITQMIASGNIPASVKPMIQPIIDLYQNAGKWDNNAAQRISSALSQGFVQGLAGKMSAKVETNPTSQLEIQRANAETSAGHLLLEKDKFQASLMTAAGYVYNPTSKSWEKSTTTTTSGKTAGTFNANEYTYDAATGLYIKNGTSDYYKKEGTTMIPANPKPAKENTPKVDAKLLQQRDTWAASTGGIFSFETGDDKALTWGDHWTKTTANGMLNGDENDWSTFLVKGDVKVLNASNMSDIKEKNKKLIVNQIDKSGYPLNEFVILWQPEKVGHDNFLVVHVPSLARDHKLGYALKRLGYDW